MRRCLKSNLPAQRWLLSGAELLKGLQIAVGKNNIKLFQQRPILKMPLADSIFYALGHPAIQGGKISGAALLVPCPVNDSIQSVDYVVNCLCRHGATSYRALLWVSFTWGSSPLTGPQARVADVPA